MPVVSTRFRFDPVADVQAGLGALTAHLERRRAEDIAREAQIRELAGRRELLAEEIAARERMQLAGFQHAESIQRGQQEFLRTENALNRALQQNLQQAMIDWYREQLAAQIGQQEADRALRRLLGMRELDLRGRQLDITAQQVPFANLGQFASLVRAAASPFVGFTEQQVPMLERLLQMFGLATGAPTAATGVGGTGGTVGTVSPADTAAVEMLRGGAGTAAGTGAGTGAAGRRRDNVFDLGNIDLGPEPNFENLTAEDMAFAIFNMVPEWLHDTAVEMTVPPEMRDQVRRHLRVLGGGRSRSVVEDIQMRDSLRSRRGQ